MPTKSDLERLFHQRLFRVAPSPVLPDSTEPGELYHYTGADGLKGILSNRFIRATNFSFLNDPSEIQYGRKLVRDTLRKQQELHRDSAKIMLKQIARSFAKKQSEVYVSCFTKLPDDLSQWRAYGNLTAPHYSIGFDLQTIRDRALTTPNTEFSEVLYKEQEQQDEIHRIANKAIEFVEEIGYSEAGKVAELAAGRLAWLLPLLKSPAYAAEKEWRVVRRIPTDDVSEVSFDTARGVVRPYVEFRLTKASGRQTTCCPSESGEHAVEEPPPVVELRVLAPGREDTSIKAARMLLRKVGIVDVHPERSKVPFSLLI